MLLLSKVYPSLSTTPAYRRYFHDLRGSDLARARQLTEDPYMLIKFKVGPVQTPAPSTSFSPVIRWPSWQLVQHDLLRAGLMLLLLALQACALAEV